MEEIYALPSFRVCRRFLHGRKVKDFGQLDVRSSVALPLRFSIRRPLLRRRQLGRRNRHRLLCQTIDYLLHGPEVSRQGSIDKPLSGIRIIIIRVNMWRFAECILLLLAKRYEKGAMGVSCVLQRFKHVSIHVLYTCLRSSGTY